MSTKPGSRPGGRSARVQQAVHQAVDDLMAEYTRSELTVPLVAARAGVTPSTIYRRWGDLAELLADVAVRRLQPDTPPDDRGELRADLDAWAEQFVDEMASAPGRAFIRDALGGDQDGATACQCSDYAVAQLDTIRARAIERGEPTPPVDVLLDHLVAPMMYRILFRPAGLDHAYARALVEQTLSVSP